MPSSPALAGPTRAVFSPKQWLVLTPLISPLVAVLSDRRHASQLVEKLEFVEEFVSQKYWEAPPGQDGKESGRGAAQLMMFISP